MIGPVRPIRPTPATDAYARFGRAASERHRGDARQAGARESLEWRVTDLPGGGRIRVRRWAVDAGDGERAIHIDAIVE